MRSRSRSPWTLALVAAATSLFVSSAFAASVPQNFADEVVADGFQQPVNFDFFPDGRVVLVERQTAQLRLVVNGAIAAIDPVGTIPDVESLGPEQGLLGVAVDPAWPTRPYVYVYFNAASSPNCRLVRYTLTGDLTFSGDGSLSLDPASARVILGDIPDDNILHQAGSLVFGPDGKLYLSIGEDGIPCAAQDIHELRGKILRLNVANVAAGPGPAPSYQSLSPPDNPWAGEFDPRARVVWQRGLRNPFSFDFDGLTGAVAIADVGSADYEEVDVVSSGGKNFGWPRYEGPMLFGFDCSYADSGTFTAPAYWYRRSSPEVEATVILGGIYRKPAPDVGFPGEYEGNLFVLDFYEGWLRRLVPAGETYVAAPLVPGQSTVNSWATGFFFPTRMRVGPDGALWYLSPYDMRRIRYTGTLVDVGGPIAGGGLRVFPVPANGPVTISFSASPGAPADVAILDVKGRSVRRLASRASFPAGDQRMTWDGIEDNGAAAPPGVYYAVVRQGAEHQSRRIVLLRP